jgi:hypothetical protein
MKLLHRYRLALALLIGLVLFPVMAYATGQVVTGQITFNAAFTEQATALTTYSIPATISSNLSYANGTLSNQVDTIYAKTITLAGTTQTIDLTSLTDPAGNAINFARVREFIVVNSATSAGFDLKVEAGSSNPVIFIPPVANFLLCRYSGTLRISDPVSTGSGNGNVVTSSTKTITFDSGANTITFLVLIVGGSAAFCVVWVPRRYRRFRLAV